MQGFKGLIIFEVRTIWRIGRMNFFIKYIPKKIRSFFVWSPWLTIITISTSIFLVLRLFFEQKILFYLVHGIFDTCQSSIINNVLLSILASYTIIYWIIQFIKSRSPTFSGLYTYGIIVILYIFYRYSQTLNGTPIEFISFKNAESIKYFDIVFFSFSMFLITTNKKQKSIDLTPENPYFIQDDFETFDEVDWLGRSPFAENLALYIKNTIPRSAFAIGISSKWGNGKTVFLHFLEIELKKLNKNFSIIKFNPWKSKEEKQVLEDFFTSFNNEVKKDYPEISNKLKVYSKSLLQINEGVLIKIINQVFDFFLPDKSLTENYVEVEQLLKDVQTKFIIFVDDLDRLSTEEILEVLRIIRNAASFPNTFFVVAYDREYVGNSIAAKRNHANNNFLEKIFQIEFQLPYYEATSIYEPFYKLIQKNRTIQEYQSIEIATKELRGLNQESPIFKIETQDFLKGYLKNLRDVVRFVNMINIDYSKKISGEVVLVDFLLLSLIKIKYIQVYNILSEKRFLKPDHDNGRDIYKYDSESMKKYLENHLSTFLINDEEITLLDNSLNFLFDKKRGVQQVRSVIFPIYFDLYFNFDLYTRISYSDFTNLRNTNYEEFLKRLKFWIDNGSKSDIINIYTRTNSFNDEVDFESFIRSMIHLDTTINETYWGIELFSKLNKVDEIQNKYYPQKPDGYKKFLLNLFTNAKFPYLTESTLAFNFLYSIMNVKDSSIKVFTSTELQNVTEVFLEKFSNETTEFNPTIAFRLYYNNYFEIKGEKRFIILTKRSNEIFKKLIYRFRIEYIKTLIVPFSPGETGKSYILEGFIEQTFGTYVNFENFLLETLRDYSDNFYLYETITFYRKYKANEYQAIDFERDTIEIISNNTLKLSNGVSSSLILKDLKTIEFEHPGYNTEGAYDDKDLFNYCKWVAHAYPITDVEAKLGGTYILDKEFNIDYTGKEFISSLIHFYVDDELSVSLNGVDIFKSSENKKRMIMVNAGTIKPGKNIYRFTIRNWSEEEIGYKIKDGYQNPYGVIFKIILKFKSL